MKSLKIIFASLLVFSATQLNAQTTPEPPTPPKTTSSSSSNTTVSVHSDDDENGTSSYSYSETSSDDKGKNKNSNVSISISSSDDSYTLRARFPEAKYVDVLTVLMDEMSSRNLTESNGKHTWKSTSNRDEVYKVVLSKTKLVIDLDKDVASESLAEKFVAMGKTLRTAISGADNEARRDAQRLQREADRLRRDAERMQREADRIQREAERKERVDVKRYRDDARALAEKARLMADEASDLGTIAGHKGGIGSHVRTMLNSSKTYYDANSKNAYNWTWPKAQKDIISALKKERLIDNDNEISFTYDRSGMYANGKKLNTTQVNNFSSIFYKNDIFKGYGFSFYKIKNNIVVISDDANMDGFIKDLVSKKYISSKNEKVKFEINGSSVYKNGKQLSNSDLQTINKLLLKNNIIPAPGKIFEIMKRGAYKVGYQAGDKTHIGTWHFAD